MGKNSSSPFTQELLSFTCYLEYNLKETYRDFPGGAVVKNPPANAGDTGLNPGPGRSHMLQGN